MPGQLAFIHYPHGPKNARLETMPFALNTVVSLANLGWSIDLYLWEQPLLGRLVSSYEDLLPKNVSVRYFTELRYSPVDPWIEHWLELRFSRQKNYLCVFGLGQKGAFIGRCIAKANQCPLIQVVDEFPSNWPQSIWTELERKAARDAAMVVVPDAQQLPLICKELDIPETTPHATLPNVAVVQSYNQQIDWHMRLKLPDGSIPFLYAGTVDIWAQVPEILATVADWPEPAVLIVHSRSRGEVETFRQAHPALEHSRIHWSNQVLSQDELNSLVAYCAGSFALYHNLGPHIEYVGFSSGKLMRSLACGSPVIASQLSSFGFVRERDLGVLVEEPLEIPAAVDQLIGKKEEYKERCLNFCQTFASFEAYWPSFCEEMVKVTGIRLQP